MKSTRLRSRVRALAPHEISALPAAFTRAFDIASVRVINRTHNPLARNKIVCRGKKLYWPGAPSDFTRAPLVVRSLLMHELCHVWQYETGRLSAFRYLINPKNWFYSYRVRQDAHFDDYPTEKQADLLQDWYLVNSGVAPMRYDPDGPIPVQSWLNRVVPFKQSRAR